MLLDSGKYKERYVMKRKENIAPKDQLTLWQKETEAQAPEGGGEEQEAQRESLQNLFLLEEGRLKPFQKEQFTRSTLYQTVESFSVECRLVRPEDPGNLMFEGKKPSRKTLPIVISRSGDPVLLESWESLEGDPRILSDAAEVIGVTPVKQVFVLRRKEE